MSEIKWTNDQLCAIRAGGDGSILVSAAAGSGKTAVLVERIIRKITNENNPADIGEFLISTFTKAAADEMREKISSRLFVLIKKNPKNPHLKKQLALIYNAHINTVHGICADMVRKNFSYLDIAPNFSLLSEDSASLLKKQTMELTLEEFYDSEDNKNFILALEMFWIKRDDKAFFKLVLDFYEKIIALPFYEDWLFDNQKKYDIKNGDDIYDIWFGELIKQDVEKMAKAYLKNYLLLKEDIFLDGTYAELYSAEVELLKDLSQDNLSFDKTFRILSGFEFERLTRAKKDTDIVLAQNYKNLRAAFKDDINKRKDSYFRGDSEHYVEDIVKLGPVIAGLFDVVRRFSVNYQGVKNDKNLLDFNDLEHLSLKLLIKKEDGEFKKTDIAKKLSRSYKEIFIDEYQDINSIQELIFFALSKNDFENLFMVGDIKQSIYRFRQADPTIFLKKYNSFFSDLQSDGNKKIILGQNFRSRGQTLDVINFIFHNVMNDYIGELCYGESEFLYKNSLYPDDDSINYNPELVIIDYSKLKTRDSDEQKQEDLSAFQKEAVVVAEKINEMMGNNFLVYDAKLGGNRPLRYGDIAVLLRTTSKKDKIFEEVLSAFGIPVYCNSKSEYFQNSDVLLMLSLLKIIDNSRQDIELLGLMRSPLFDFSEDDILELRLKYKDADIFDMLKAGYDAENKKCVYMLDFIYGLKKKSGNMTVYELIMHIYESTGYLSMIKGMKNSKIRRANLNTLYNLAKDYESTHYRGIFNFINYVNNLIENKNDITVIKTGLEGQNSVKIMSIHKSKGLEFGVCFVCDLNKRFNKNDLRQSIVFHKEYGIGTDFKESNKMIYYPTIVKQAIAIKLNLELLSEELRILYVALTRAKQKLIMVASARDINKTLKEIGALDAGKVGLEGYFSSAARSNLEFLIMGLKLYRLLEVEHLKNYKVKAFDSALELCILDGEKVLFDLKDQSEQKEKNQIIIDNPYIKLLEERFGAKYKFKELKDIPIKLSVTELKGKILDDELEQQLKEDIKKAVQLKKPRFVQKQTALSAAQKGSAMHLFMQFADFEAEGLDKADGVNKQLFDMVELEKLTKQQADAIDIPKVLDFFKSDIARRIKASKRVYREQKFNLGISAKRFFDTSCKDENMLIQGVIDCFFIEDDIAVLIDFKTDRVLNAADFKRKYAFQLEIYKEAIEKIYDIKVKQKLIYSFYLGKCIEV